MRKILAIFLILLMLGACEKEADKRVKYIVTDNDFGFKVNYRDESGAVETSSIPVSSSEDMWTYEFTGKKGDIVFVSAIYENPNDAIKIQILLDGKVFKQGSSKGDTIRYVTVSGTIPYE